MTTIYCVFTGCYSDTTLVGVFSSKENAQLLIDKNSIQYIKEVYLNSTLTLEK